MRKYNVKIKVIYDKKSLFYDKEELHDICVEISSEAKKCQAELVAIEKSKAYIKSKRPRVFKKKAYKIVVISCKPDSDLFLG